MSRQEAPTYTDNGAKYGDKAYDYEPPAHEHRQGTPISQAEYARRHHQRRAEKIPQLPPEPQRSWSSSDEEEEDDYHVDVEEAGVLHHGHHSSSDEDDIGEFEEEDYHSLDEEEDIVVHHHGKRDAYPHERRLDRVGMIYDEKNYSHERQSRGGGGTRRPPPSKEEEEEEEEGGGEETEEPKTEEGDPWAKPDPWGASGKVGLPTTDSTCGHPKRGEGGNRGGGGTTTTEKRPVQVLVPRSKNPPTTKKRGRPTTTTAEKEKEEEEVEVTAASTSRNTKSSSPIVSSNANIPWVTTSYNFAVEGKPSDLHAISDNTGDLRLGLGNGVTVLRADNTMSDRVKLNLHSLQEKNSGAPKQPTNQKSSTSFAGPKLLNNDIVGKVVLEHAHNPYPFDLEFRMANISVPNHSHPQSSIADNAKHSRGDAHKSVGTSFFLHAGQTIHPPGIEIGRSDIRTKEVGFHAVYPHFDAHNLDDPKRVSQDVNGKMKVLHTSSNPHPVVDYFETMYAKKKGIDSKPPKNLFSPSLDDPNYVIMDARAFKESQAGVTGVMSKVLSPSDVSSPQVFVRPIRMGHGIGGTNLDSTHEQQQQQQQQLLKDNGGGSNSNGTKTPLSQGLGGKFGAKKSGSSASNTQGTTSSNKTTTNNNAVSSSEKNTYPKSSSLRGDWIQLDNYYNDGKDKFAKAFARINISSVPSSGLRQNNTT